MKSSIFAFGIALMATFLFLPPSALAGEVIFDMPTDGGADVLSWGRSDSDLGLEIGETIFPSGFPEGISDVCEVGLWIARSGEVSDNVTLSVYYEWTASTNPQDQQLIGQASIAGSSLPTATDEKTIFKLSQCTGSDRPFGTFWYVLGRSQPDSDGSYLAQVTQTGQYPSMHFIAKDTQGNWAQDNTRELRISLEKSGTTQAKTPVLIIPGIAGTELYNGDDLIWADLEQMFGDVNDEFLSENLGLDGQGESINEIEAKKVIDIIFNIPLLSINIFKDLNDELLESGYSSDQSLFYFPYDWRLDLDATKDLINSRIEEIKSQTNSPNVDIIAHSMGGLLVKNYLNDYGSQSVRKLIFVGTPHLGAPKAGKVVLEGDRLSIPWLEPDRIKEIAKKSPALHQLLPQPDYFETSQGYLFKNSVSQPLSYNETRDLVIEQNSSDTMMSLAEDFWSKNLEDYEFSGMDVYNITGCKSGTQAGYRLKSDNIINKVGYTSGDGTVPMISADYINIPGEHKLYLKKASHAEMPSQEDVRSAILNILEGGPLVVSGNLKLDSDECGFKGKTLTWKSPIDVHVYDSEGNHSGPIQDGLENSIAGVDYEIIDGHKFIFLPTGEGQEYDIEAEGTASGSFDLVITVNDNGSENESSVFNDISILPNSQIRFTVDDGSLNEAIQVDREDDGSYQNLGASAILNQNELTDSIAPVTLASVSGTQGSSGWYLDNVSVTLTAQDDTSGILETRYSFNGQTYEFYQGPIVISAEGITTLSYYSVDRAGNNEEIQTTLIQIDRQVPDFSIQFNTTTKSFDIGSKDGGIACGPTSCTVSDQAGNTATLEFLKLKYSNTYTLTLRSVTENGQRLYFKPNLFVIKFVSKNSQISEFSQTFLLDNKEVTRVEYDPRTNRSTVFRYEDGLLQKAVVTGIEYLQLETTRDKIGVRI